MGISILDKTPEELSDLFSEAFTYQNEKAFDKAIGIYNDFIANGIVSIEVYENLAYCFFSLKQYQKIIDLFNTNIHLEISQFKINYYRSCAYFHLDDFNNSQKFLEVCLQISPSNSQIIHNLAIVHMKKNDFERAIKYFEKCCELSLYNVDIYLNLGKCFALTDRFDEAISFFDKALSIDENLYEAHLNRAISLQKMQKYDQAVIGYNHVLEFSISDESVVFAKGYCLNKLGRVDEQLKFYKSVLKYHEKNQELLQEIAKILFAKDQFSEAIYHLNKILNINPYNAEVYLDLANIYQKLNEYEKAIYFSEKAIAIDEKNPRAYLNKGYALASLGKLQESFVLIRKSLEIEPTPLACSNLGALLIQEHHFEEAEKILDDAIEKFPFDEACHFSRALLYIYKGDFIEGFKGYEWRYNLKENQVVMRNYPFPKLSHLDVKGKKIYVYCEQGLGDKIQFCRFAKSLEDLGAIVYLEVDQVLHPLISTLSSAIKVVSYYSDMYNCDYHIAVMSLPYLFKTTILTIPFSKKYVYTTPTKNEKWKKIIGEKRSVKIGFCINGSNSQFNDQRNLPINDLLPIFSLPCDFYFIQKNIEDDHLRTISAFNNVYSYHEHIKDFSDTASYAECMDLVISIDTSVAHLCGALSIPTWLLLPYSADYRWMIDREDTPWYESIRIFRQNQSKLWQEVINKIKGELIQKFGLNGEQSAS